MTHFPSIHSTTHPPTHPHREKISLVAKCLSKEGREFLALVRYSLQFNEGG